MRTAFSTDSRPKHAHTQSTRLADVRMINQVDTTMILLEAEKEMSWKERRDQDSSWNANVLVLVV